MDRITMTLKEYLEQGYSLPDKIDTFAELSIGNVSYNIKELFIERNSWKEIGSETQELFKINLTSLLNTAHARYNPQLVLLQDNFNDLMSRVAKEKVSGTETNTTEGESVEETNTNYEDKNFTNETENYLNPANTNATILTGKDKQTLNGKRQYGGENTTTVNNTNTKTIDMTNERIFGFFKSNPEVLKSAMEISANVVEDIMTYLDRAFIGEY